MQSRHKEEMRIKKKIGNDPQIDAATRASAKLGSGKRMQLKRPSTPAHMKIK
jgi:hypothetical protein